MKLSFQKSTLPKIKADVAAMFLIQDEKPLHQQMQKLNEELRGALQPILSSKDFRGKEKETVLVYLPKSFPTQRLLLVGLGEKKKLTHEVYRRASAQAAKKARELKAEKLALCLPDLGPDAFAPVVAFAEGAALGLYRFDKYITKKEDNETRVTEIILCSNERSVIRTGKKAVHEAAIITEAVTLARNLANAPGNEIYPQTLAEAARRSGKTSGYRVTVLNEKEIAKLGMGGVIAVSQGSARPPRFIIMEYGSSSQPPVVLVGKGVTFDTGGISIKPASGMAEMKMDMSGAAAVIGTFQAAAQLKLPVHLVGLIPAVENMLSGSATRPGDIIRHYNGKTSEVDNTDAEGRLILADALAYAERFKPAAVIDLATLTGACVVALGHVVTGMMGNDSTLMSKLKAAGEETYERVWELPLYDEYEKLIKSDVADVKNVGGRWAGAITAAWFLKKFIGDYKWVHLDIAGTAMLEENSDYTQKGASGVGVRLLTHLLKNWK